MFYAYLNPEHHMVGNLSVGLIETVFDSKSANKIWSWRYVIMFYYRKVREGFPPEFLYYNQSKIILRYVSDARQ